MNTTGNNKGDDAYFDRLLSYFRSQFNEEILQMVAIRTFVFLVKTEKNRYILKGYRTNSRLKLQEVFTATLRKEGFSKTYRFVSPSVKEPLFFEGMYFGCIEYIEPNQQAFSFYSPKNRQQGMDLLEHFHRVTATFEARYRTLLPKGNLIGKWKERLQLFLSNLPYLRYFVHESFLSEMVSWAHWSLEGMEKNRAYFLKEPFVILHGDVAHHNFLRNSIGKLYLIDFDLISIGPDCYDYLQYVNRILPSMDWSFEQLSRIKQIRRYIQDEAFLYALVYPADIFREWNRMIRERSYTDQVKLQQIMDGTIGQFIARKKFIDDLKDRLNVS